MEAATANIAPGSSAAMETCATFVLGDRDTAWKQRADRNPVRDGSRRRHPWAGYPLESDLGERADAASGPTSSQSGRRPRARRPPRRAAPEHPEAQRGRSPPAPRRASPAKSNTIAPPTHIETPEVRGARSGSRARPRTTSLADGWGAPGLRDAAGAAVEPVSVPRAQGMRGCAARNASMSRSRSGPVVAPLASAIPSGQTRWLK